MPNAAVSSAAVALRPGFSLHTHPTRQRRHLGRAWAVAEAAIDEGRQNDHGAGQQYAEATQKGLGIHPANARMLPECNTLLQESGGTGSNSVGVTNKICKLQPLTVADGTRPSEHQADSGLARPDLRVCADLSAGRRCYARVSQSNRGSPLAVGAGAHATDIRAKADFIRAHRDGRGIDRGLVSGVA
jgi:hypothetical protein